jgi:uncharacterized delta-60 repeat protein
MAGKNGNRRMPPVVSVALISAIVAWGLTAPAVAGAAFGPDEREALGFSASSEDAVAYPGGRLLLLDQYREGREQVVRLRRDGSVDRSFANTEVPFEFVTDMAVQPDGDIVLVGGRGARGPEFESSEMVVARLLPNGSLDRSFGQGGMKVVSFGKLRERASSVAIGSDGRIVIGGFSGLTTTRPEVIGAVVARLLPGGAYDRSFSGNGRVWLKGGPESELGGVSDVAALPSGKVVADASGDFVDTVLRLRADGVPDRKFGHGGQIAVGPPGTERSEDRYFEPIGQLGIRPRGGLKMVGTTYLRNKRDGATSSITAIAYRSDGSLDRSFGKGGVLNTGTHNVASAFAMLPDGALLVSGGNNVERGTFPAFGFDAKGKPDSRFGDGGRANVSFAGKGWANRARAIVPQGRGRVLFVGVVRKISSERRFPWLAGLARLHLHREVRQP